MDYKSNIIDVVNIMKSEGFTVFWGIVEHFTSCNAYTINDKVWLPALRRYDLDMFRIVSHELQHLRQYAESKFCSYIFLHEILLAEYDAEKRSLEFIQKEYGKVKINPAWYVITSNKYMKYLKWLRDEYDETNDKYILDYYDVDIKVLDRWMTDSELCEDLTEDEKSIFYEHYVGSERTLVYA